MDDDLHPAVARFVPDRRVTVLAGLGAAVALVVAILDTDGPGRLLAAIAVAVLLAYAVGDLVFSPRLTVDREGLTLRTPSVRARVPWDDVEHVRADTRMRYGLRSTTLEVDAGAVFAVLSRRSLGAQPEDVAALVAAFRPPA